MEKIDKRDNHRVSIVRCKSYDPELVKERLAAVIDLLEVPPEPLFKDKKVLIKPNMLAARPPEEAVTTHPEVIRALIQLARKMGGEPCLGDSPALGDFKRVARISGLETVAREEKASLVEFDHPVKLPVPESYTFKGLQVAAPVLEAGITILNAPKLKTHQMMVMTAAVKNMFGAVCGLEKGGLHLHAGRDQRWFARMLVEITEVLAPKLTVMDAVEAMEGEGPAAGKKKKIGLLLASTSATALDTVCAGIMRLSPGDVPTLAMAAELGIPGSSIDQVDIVGERLCDVVPEEYEMPGSALSVGFSLPGIIRSSLLKLTMPRSVPVFINKCTRCQACSQVCPAKAVSVDESGPKITTKLCIGCFCCSEVCPEKVFISKGGRIGRLLTSISRAFLR